MATARASITRVVTEEGIVGEAYAGDEDETLGEIVGGDPRRDRAAADRPERLRLRALLGARLPRHLRPAARPADRARRARLRRLRDLGRDRQGRSASRSGSSGAATATGSRSTSSAATTGATSTASATRSTEWRELGFRGCKFKVGGRTPAEDAERVARRARGGRRRLRDHDRRQPGLHAARRRSTSATACATSTSAGSRSRASGRNDRRDMRDVRARGGIPVCAGQSEYSPEGCRDLMEARRDRRLQLRRLVVRAATRTGGAWRRSAQLYSVELAPPRGAAGRGRTCSRASRTARTSRSSTPTATRSGGA